MRLPLDVIDVVRESVGGDFTVGVRLNADEMNPRGGLTLEDTKKIAARLEASGQEKLFYLEGNSLL